MRAVRQHVDEPRHLLVDRAPVVDGRTSQSGRVRDRRDVQQQVRRAADRRVHDHRVAHGGVGENLARLRAGAHHGRRGARRSHRDVLPDRLTRRRERRVRHRQSERFGDHLRRRRRPEELTSAARRRARAASELGSLFERHRSVRVARADRLGGAGVDAVGRRQRDAAGHHDRGDVVAAGERHQHRGQALVARRDADHRAARRQRSHQPPEHDRGVVAIGQAVHHAVRALRAAVARIGDEAGKRDHVRRAQRLGRGAHEQPDFPVAGVIAEGEGSAVGLANAALRAEDEDFGLLERGGLPAHADVLRPAEDVAARPRQQIRRFERQRARGAGLRGSDVVEGVVAGVEDGWRRHVSCHLARWWSGRESSVDQGDARRATDPTWRFRLTSSFRS